MHYACRVNAIKQLTYNPLKSIEFGQLGLGRQPDYCLHLIILTLPTKTVPWWPACMHVHDIV